MDAEHVCAGNQQMEVVGAWLHALAAHQERMAVHVVGVEATMTVPQTSTQRNRHASERSGTPRGTGEGYRKVAALYVLEDGPYANLPDVEVWGVSRDARLYNGPWPVVAHPPCARWCRLAGLVEARWGHKRGEDDGCFEAALAAVRRWGGVLEHPAYTDAWPGFGLPAPNRHGGWQHTLDGGMVAHVEQGRYGHLAKKATWLYAVGVKPAELLWGSSLDVQSKALVSWCGNHVRSGENRPRVGKDAASRTPVAFRRVLLDMARTADPDKLRRIPRFRDQLISMARSVGVTA